jgi:ribonuclease HI
MPDLSRTSSVAFVDGSVDVNKNAAFSRGAGAAVLISVDRGAETPLVSEMRLMARYSEGYDSVTNNTMELTAFQVALENMADQSPIRIWSDSKYAIGVLFNAGWKAGQNRKLIHKIKALVNGRTVLPNYIRGHSDCFLNELADLVASRAVEKRKDVDYLVPMAKGTHLVCLACRHFPCDVPPGQWKHIFTAIRDRSWQECARVNKYAILDLKSGTNSS